MTTLETRFAEAEPNLSTSRKRLIREILDHPEDTYFLSSRALAKRYELDPTTIVRTVHEFYFVTMGNRLMQAQTANQPNFHINSVRALFQFDFPNFPSPLWDVSADGQRFAVLTADHTKSASITLLTNWPAELGK
jgi:hypothetical protein